MSNKFYSLPRLSFGTDLASALIDKYGAGNVTLHYVDDMQVIFNCSLISNKVLRIYKEQLYYNTSEFFDRLNCTYGDSYSVGTTITNVVQFCGNSRSGSSIDTQAYIDFADLVLGDHFMLICFPTNRPQMCLVGIATNEMPFCIGWNSEAGSNWAKALPTDGVTKGEIEFPVQPFPYYDNGKYVIQPLLMIISGRILKNLDGTFATINGIYNAAHNVRVATDKVYISPANWYNNANQNAYAQLPTALFCPIETQV
ncbi:MAG: hypothetical protein GX867_09970 [Tissierellia bacterium]|nr:hypothetical protein [Tissierellia bacterium]